MSSAATVHVVVLRWLQSGSDCRQDDVHIWLRRLRPCNHAARAGWSWAPDRTGLNPSLFIYTFLLLLCQDSACPLHGLLMECRSAAARLAHTGNYNWTEKQHSSTKKDKLSPLPSYLIVHRF